MLCVVDPTKLTLFRIICSASFALFTLQMEEGEQRTEATTTKKTWETTCKTQNNVLPFAALHSGSVLHTLCTLKNNKVASVLCIGMATPSVNRIDSLGSECVCVSAARSFGIMHRWQIIALNRKYAWISWCVLRSVARVASTKSAINARTRVVCGEWRSEEWLAP